MRLPRHPKHFGVCVTDKPFTIQLETDDFVVIDKAPGIPMHREEEQLGISSYLKASTGHANWFLCHRLDRDTSGLLLMAKNKEAAGVLSQLFAERQVEKYYVAITDRRPKQSQGFISGDMEKARDGNWMLSQTQTRPAQTQFYSRSLRPGLRAIMLKPRTGRTHQLRVALAALAAPILGDSRYRGNASDRMYLHACGLGFSYQGEKHQVFCAPSVGTLFEDFFTGPDDPWLQPALLLWPKKG